MSLHELIEIEAEILKLQAHRKAILENMLKNTPGTNTSQQTIVPVQPVVIDIPAPALSLPEFVNSVRQPVKRYKKRDLLTATQRLELQQRLIKLFQSIE